MAMNPLDVETDVDVVASNVSASATPLAPQYPTTSVIVAGYVLASILAVAAGYALMID
ncbi:hypothetical protein [Alloyangia pacifica]|uniref:Uncharacterized protein n=1 Tax=Alloyangia pacifica TaxID=311180 RepID=A0A1I6SVH7_9RHOB|nr:hypothetical protein [Alloyangia pacifica]SDG89124.1 hypothetical protein SAMN04488245_10590 [Alloyangia pacifica]SFS80974.1 hypothetical protein SAMN04488050_10590 [Alloyangia pacifica]